MPILQKGIYNTMRVIKFRGLSVRPDVDWVYGDVHYGVNNEKAHIHHMKGSNTSCFVDPKTIGQFTGLLDKNGVEIYEGDVVRILYTDWPSQNLSSRKQMSLDEYKKSISRFGYVKYFADDKAAEFAIQFKGYSDRMYEGKHGEKEVIGNIHANPGLLNKEQ